MAGHNRRTGGGAARVAGQHDGEDQQPNTPLVMQRGASQLLFSYLPMKTVDWENGLAIVQLGGVRLARAWDLDRGRPVLEEIAARLERWRGSGEEQAGGIVDRRFPDPLQEAERFVIGEPEAIQANLFETALHCTSCSRLVFRRMADLARDGFQCPHCRRATLRQFGQVLVHGCGELIPIQQFLPSMHKDADGRHVPSRQPLRCRKCGQSDELVMPARSERSRDMTIYCQRCKIAVLDRITGRCRRCLQEIATHQSVPAPSDAGTEQGDTPQPTVVARVAMRMTSFRASEAYYAHSLTMLRLGRPAVVADTDPTIGLLRRLLPAHRRPDANTGVGAGIGELARQLTQAESLGDKARVERLTTQIANLALNVQVQEPLAGEASITELPRAASDVPRLIEESLAFRTTVSSQPALDLVQRRNGAGALILDRLRSDLRRLGLREIAHVDDLPVITATFGYSRRSFEPTYEELGVAGLPTTLRPFPALDNWAARLLGKAELAGTVPILAREGEHEGIFLALEPDRVARWVEANGVALPRPGDEPLVRLLAGLEEVDRYHDRIWECRVRRLVFGLVHTLSHALMRAASRLAGLERTSVSEYTLLPLLGTVVYDNSSTFKLGGMEMAAGDHLGSLIDALQDEAMSCIFDVSCIDRQGACPGCLHSPEIACRVFNHGLSRAFLVGGHAPWADVASEERVTGYWELEA